MNNVRICILAKLQHINNNVKQLKHLKQKKEKTYNNLLVLIPLKLYFCKIDILFYSITQSPIRQILSPWYILTCEYFYMLSPKNIVGTINFKPTSDHLTDIYLV